MLNSIPCYQVNKKEVLEALSGAENAVIYGGDSHNAWAGVESLDGVPVAVEFDGPAVTSPGFESYFGFAPKALMEAGMVAGASEHGLKYNEIMHKVS